MTLLSSTPRLQADRMVAISTTSEDALRPSSQGLPLFMCPPESSKIRSLWFKTSVPHCLLFQPLSHAYSYSIATTTNPAPSNPPTPGTPLLTAPPVAAAELAADATLPSILVIVLA